MPLPIFSKKQRGQSEWVARECEFGVWAKFLLFFIEKTQEALPRSYPLESENS